MKDYELLEILAALTTTYRIKPEAEAAYRLALADEDGGLIGEAVKRWIKTEIWPPRPAELINLANDIAEQQIKDGVRSLPMPERVQLPVADAKRLLGKLIALGYRRAHPNLIAAAYGRPPAEHDHTSEPIPGELIAELTRGAA